MFRICLKSFHAILLILGLLSTPWAIAQPVKIKPIAVTGSGLGAGTKFGYAVDDLYSNYWNAGGYAPQWIQLDFGRPIALRKLRLLTSQSPAGTTSHQVYVSNRAPAADGSNMKQVWSATGHTTDGQWLEFQGDASDGTAIGMVRYVRIKTTQSPSWVGWVEIQAFQGVERVGYYGGEYEGQTQGANVSSATKLAGANLLMIASGNPSFISQKLGEANANGMRVVLKLANQMFNPMFDANGFSGVPLRLRSDRATLLASVVQAANAYPGILAAVYPYDEPYTVGLGGVRKLEPAKYANGTPDFYAELARIKTELATASNELKTTYFPGVPVASIATRDPIDMDRDPSYFAMFDWLGYDCYDTWSNCGGDTVQASFRAKLSNASQRLMSIPWAMTKVPTSGLQYCDGRTSNGSPTVEDQRLPIQNIDDWNQRIIRDGRYVSAMPFYWNVISEALTCPNGVVAAQMVGAKSLPLVQSRVKQLSLSLEGKNISANGWAIAEDTNSAPASRRIVPVKTYASNTYSTALPFMAVDGATNNYWTAGGFAPQWIAFDFGGNTRINNMDLLVSQSPNGNAQHVLESANYELNASTNRLECPAAGSASWVVFGNFTGWTTDAQVLQWQGVVDADCLRVRTVSSPSWVGWVEIKFRQDVPAILN